MGGLPPPSGPLLWSHITHFFGAMWKFRTVGIGLVGYLCYWEVRRGDSIRGVFKKFPGTKEACSDKVVGFVRSLLGWEGWGWGREG